MHTAICVHSLNEHFIWMCWLCRPMSTQYLFESRHLYNNKVGSCKPAHEVEREVHRSKWRLGLKRCCHASTFVLDVLLLVIRDAYLSFSEQDTNSSAFFLRQVQNDFTISKLLLKCIDLRLLNQHRRIHLV